MHSPRTVSYTHLDVYKRQPYKKNGYTSGAHGTNEKAVVESLAPAAALYIELMKNLCTQEGRAL